METHLPYLVSLNQRLAEAAAQWPAESTAPHARFILSRMGADGGFIGRAGASDLYYTAFALRALTLLGAFDDDARAAAAAYLHAQTAGDTIAAVSLLFSRWMATGASVMRQEPHVGAVVAGLESLRTPDGGYAKAPGGSASTYHTFLAALCYDLLGRAAPGADEIAAFIRSRRRDDGGFAELARMPRSSVNPTAAAAALLAATGNFDEILLDDAADFLTGVQRPDGGWPASGRAPASDLLSTFTALLTLSDLGTADRADLPGAARFMHACRADDGGFGAVPDDPAADVEYTFYGLGAAVILGEQP